ncbi:MAG: hypothetical protein UX74_C0008G0003 [Parcubacteria group bacterium GW2011_GWA2_47_10b]|nr:MAG: hypothetical protein UX74_C0008G0003 [Parcubacteria group bacterium GW2011_GWA2_47_10b]KKU86205.1 MAG: hypothetical protein UY14_C0005G0003 [Parcubacteria group bacterium GW2011_GWA1_47_9]
MVFSFLAIIISGYIFFQSSSIFTTPDLAIETPPDGALIQGNRVLVQGMTVPSAKVTINGYETFSDEAGFFNISLPFQRGFHIIDIRVVNRVGNEARAVRRIVVE